MRATDTAAGGGALPRVAVWDGPVRIVHWALVLLIGFSWYSAETGLMDWHRRSGYAVLALVIFRLLWGVAGSSTARFSRFVTGPRAVGRYVGTLHRRAPGGHVGHNPLGALSVIALLLVLALQVTTGLFAVDVDGIESGPLSSRVSFDRGRWMAEVHHAGFTALQILVALHVVAVVAYLLYKRDNLIAPMITGFRRSSGAAMQRATPLRLAVAVLIAGAATWLVSRDFHL